MAHAQTPAANTSRWPAGCSRARNDRPILHRQGDREHPQHPRPARPRQRQFVKLASSFDAEIHVTRDGVTVNALSIMGLLMLGAGTSCGVEIVAEGAQAEEAVAALSDLIERKFDEGSSSRTGARDRSKHPHAQSKLIEACSRERVAVERGMRMRVSGAE